MIHLISLSLEEASFYSGIIKNAASKQYLNAIDLEIRKKRDFVKDER